MGENCTDSPEKAHVGCIVPESWLPFVGSLEELHQAVQGKLLKPFLFLHEVFSLFCRETFCLAICPLRVWHEWRGTPFQPHHFVLSPETIGDEPRERTVGLSTSTGTRTMIA